MCVLVCVCVCVPVNALPVFMPMYACVAILYGFVLACMATVDACCPPCVYAADICVAILFGCDPACVATSMLAALKTPCKLIYPLACTCVCMFFMGALTHL